MRGRHRRRHPKCYHPKMALLEVAGLSKSYSRRSGIAGTASEEKLVVDRVSFTIERGETLGLVGESGSGKSTVARMILGLIEPSAGVVTFDGSRITGASSRELRPLRRRLQPVF
ncbi:MAG TPA: ATP-binding cassette domain-containing protein, partial [Acidisarcina sp.]